MITYTEDTHVQQTTADYFEQQLSWHSVYTFNNENFRQDCLMNGELPL